MQTKRGDKVRFVLSQPTSLTAQEVVEAAKASGFSLTPGYVHTVRHRAKGAPSAAPTAHAAPVAAAPQAPKPRRGRPAKAATAAVAATATNGNGAGIGGEKSFRKLVADIGLSRARQVLTDIEQRFTV